MSNGERSNFDALRADVQETTDVLKTTVEKLVKRGENLETMNSRAEDLNTTSAYFRGSSRQLNRRMQWQNYRLTICLILSVAIVILVTTLLIVFRWKH